MNKIKIVVIQHSAVTVIVDVNSGISLLHLCDESAKVFSLRQQPAWQQQRFLLCTQNWDRKIGHLVCHLSHSLSSHQPSSPASSSTGFWRRGKAGWEENTFSWLFAERTIWQKNHAKWEIIVVMKMKTNSCANRLGCWFDVHKSEMNGKSWEKW